MCLPASLNCLCVNDTWPIFLKPTILFNIFLLDVLVNAWWYIVCTVYVYGYGYIFIDSTTYWDIGRFWEFSRPLEIPPVIRLASHPIFLVFPDGWEGSENQVWLDALCLSDLCTLILKMLSRFTNAILDIQR